MTDKYNLARFRNAQEHGVYEKALAEIKSGRKLSHWMWFIFPQIEGLGHSRTSRFYSLKSADEARAYLEDGLLAGRLREICEALLGLPGNDPVRVFGTPDWMKLSSSMTLFDYVSPDDVFAKVLDKYYGGNRDMKTKALLEPISKKI